MNRVAQFITKSDSGRTGGIIFRYAVNYVAILIKTGCVQVEGVQVPHIGDERFGRIAIAIVH